MCVCVGGGGGGGGVENITDKCCNVLSMKCVIQFLTRNSVTFFPLFPVF